MGKLTLKIIIMSIYYRFQHEYPIAGEELHCFKSLEEFKGFIKMLKFQDPNFHTMKFWEIQGTFVSEDEGDAIVRVISSKRLYL